MPDIPGEAPTLDETLHFSAAAALAPEKTLDRLDAFAKYLLGLTALVATLLTGFGVISATAVPASPWMLVPMFLFCVSLGLAISGITPKVATLNLNDLTSVEQHYKQLIAKRAGFVWYAGLLFAIGIFSVPVCVLLTKAPELFGDRPEEIRTSAQLSRSAKELSLSGSVDVANVAQGSCVRTTISGSEAEIDPKTVPASGLLVVLADRLTHPKGDGTAAVAISLVAINPKIRTIAAVSVKQPCQTPIVLSVGPDGQ